MPGKKDGKHLVVAVSIEGDAITVQAHRLNNPNVPMHQLMMANHEEVLAAVERYLPRAFWSKSWWYASPSCTKVEKIRGKICRLGSKPALLRRLGPCVTKEELESLLKKNESVTRIFEKMLLFFLIFKKK